MLPEKMFQEDLNLPYNEFSKNNSIEEESIIKNIFNYKGVESCVSPNSNSNIYFLSSVKSPKNLENSNQNTNSKPNENQEYIEIRNSFNIMDDYDYAFNKLFNTNKENNELEGEPFLEKDEENSIKYRCDEFPIFQNSSIFGDNNEFFSAIKIQNEEDLVINLDNLDYSKKQKKLNIETEEENNNILYEKPQNQENKIKPIKKKSKRGKRGPYKKKKKDIIKTITTGDCFPFTTGKGLLSKIKTKEQKENDVSEENNDMNTNDNKLQLYMNNLFEVKNYVIDSVGNKKKVKKKRKFKSDDIRKKIKVRFHKVLKNIINENLKKACSTELFSFLPQLFIGNISKKFNSLYMNITYEELLSINFSDFQNDYPNKGIDYKQFIRNKKTLEYLAQNKEISRMSGFDIIKKMKYKEILKNYFNSDEFEKSIDILKKEKESYKYIQEYILMAKSYLAFFSCN